MNPSNLDRFRQQSLRQGQMKMLEILDCIDGICKENKIEYWIEGGTLLGAVRHGGFIPWDDDLDVSMMRKDYEKFLEVAPSALGKGMFLQTKESDRDFFHKEAKVRDLNSYIADAGDDNGLRYQKGIFVDVFPYDVAPDRCRKRMGRIARSICVSDVALSTPCRMRWRSVIQFLIFKMRLPLLLFLWKAGVKLWGSGRYLAIDPHFSWCRAIHRREALFPLGEVEFEGKSYPAPANPDEYLTSLYGDWRQIPPKHKQQIHSLIIIPQLIKPQQ